ncbi:S1 family peptidase [Streptomyces sp. NPDC056160]|uniref:S1 family peptidase n=1 Tax=Streptomyces sp. NPDC056160 TaxID=3345731 RepID=UPI0035D5A9DC
MRRAARVTRALGDTVVVRRAAAPFTPLAAGGDAIWGSGVRCSLGFDVSVSGAPYFLTAGHCGNDSWNWSGTQGGQEIGQTFDSHFPGTDYALVQYGDGGADPPAPSTSTTAASSRSLRRPTPTSASVQRSGSTTGVHGGTVTGLDATVNYQAGSVSGLIDTDVCAAPGDRGGSLFDGDTAIGLTSGGSGDCTFGGETSFQPVTAALAAEGATIP